MHSSGIRFLLTGETAPWTIQAPSQIQTKLFGILQLNYLQKLSSGPDLTLFPDSRGLEQNIEALNNLDKIRLGHDALCSGRNPSVGSLSCIIRQWTDVEKTGIVWEMTKIWAYQS